MPKYENFKQKIQPEIQILDADNSWQGLIWAIPKYIMVWLIFITVAYILSFLDGLTRYIL